MKVRQWLFVLFVAILFVGCGGNEPLPVEPTPTPTEDFVNKASVPDTEPQSVSSVELEEMPTPHPSQKVMLGVYPRGLVHNTIDEITAFDQWISSAGKRVSVAGTFLDFNDPELETRVPAELETAWKNGYILFINLAVRGYSAEEIADGELDEDIRAWARTYAGWADEGGRRAFIAPLQEMNGYWTAYSGDPEHFKLAYKRIRRIFDEEGVDPRSVSWVFAPNGWSPEGLEFEKFYPGDDIVDVVGFSSFNFGECSNYPQWETYSDIYAPYLQRLRKMAPDKPIFVAEVGTVAEGGGKNQWLLSTINQLADFPNLRAILYFNRYEFASSLPGCPDGTDYRVYNQEEDEGYLGFLEAISSERFTYYQPTSDEMSEIMFNRP